MNIFQPTITGSLNISGSLNVTQGITGSLLGTASYALTSAGGAGGLSQGQVVAISTGISNLF